MPLPPDRPITEKTETLSKRFDKLEKRFDAFVERKKINDAADDEDEDEDELLDPEEELREPAEEALRNSPGLIWLILISMSLGTVIKEPNNGISRLDRISETS